MEDTFKFYIKGKDTLYTYKKINHFECVITYEVDGANYTHYTYILYIKQEIESGNYILAETNTFKYYFKDDPSQEFTYTSDGIEWATLTYKTHNLGWNTKIKIDDFKELVESGDVVLLYPECLKTTNKEKMSNPPSIYQLIQEFVEVVGEDKLRKILPLLVELDKVISTDASKTV